MKTLAIFIFYTFLILFAAYLFIYFEGRILAFFGRRSYPKGKVGLLLPVSNAIKLLSKLDNEKNSGFLYFIAPIIALCPIITAFCLIVPSITGATENSINILTILALGSIPVISMLFTTFDTQNKCNQIGAMQMVLQVLNLQIPLFISIFTPSIMAGSLDINKIIEAQSGSSGLFGWFFIPGILSCAVFFICILTILNIFSKTHSNTSQDGILDYTEKCKGANLALLLLSRHALLFTAAILITTLFFGGGLNPFGIWFLPKTLIFVEQFFWLMLKSALLVFTLVLININLVKPHYKRVLEFTQNVLLPATLINLAIALIIQYYISPKP